MIKVYQDHPDHQSVGKLFRAWDGYVYYCDSYDSRWGFWMHRIDCSRQHEQDETSEFRKNVSERAIGRTFHQIYDITS